MQDWKQAFWLAKFELKASMRGLLGPFLFFFVIGLLIITSTGSYLEKNYAGFDALFILIFLASMTWMKPKDFQSIKINGNLLVSPSLIMLKQLSIKQQVIVKSRFIIHFVYAFPFQLALLISLYLLTPELQEMMTIHSYGFFSIIWLSFGIYAGYIFPQWEAGVKVNIVTTIIGGFMFMIGAMLIFGLIQVATGHSIVHWTLIFAQKWPIPSATVSIILAIIGFNYWQWYMEKTMEKLDYL